MTKFMTVSNIVTLHWIIYWVMNGLDKFFARKDFLLFKWHGKDRMDQFSGYLSNSEISTIWVKPLLYVTGIIEFIVAVPLMILLTLSLAGKKVSRTFFENAFFASVLVFVGFSFFDVILGDRAELWEHGTFLIGVLVSYMIVRDDLLRRNLL